MVVMMINMENKMLMMRENMMRMMMLMMDKMMMVMMMMEKMVMLMMMVDKMMMVMMGTGCDWWGRVMARGNNQKSLPGQGEGFNLCITQCVTNITYISNAHFSLVESSWFGLVEILIVDYKLYDEKTIREIDSTIVRFFNVSIPQLQPTPIPKVRAETVICM